MIRNWQHMARTGDYQLAFLQMSLGFPQLPGLMVMNIWKSACPARSRASPSASSGQDRWPGPSIA